MSLNRQMYRRLLFLLVFAATIVTSLIGITLWRQLDSTAQADQLPTSVAAAVLTTQTTVVNPSPLPATFTPAAVEPSLTPTPILSATPGPSPTFTDTPTHTPVPTDTPVPSTTPTSLPQIEPTLIVAGAGIWPEGLATPPTAIPSPVPTFEVPDDTTNILLLGSDTPLGDEEARTDTLIVVTINRSGPTASMISLPRDLFVYIPGKSMGRLNTAMRLEGVELLKQTILYNFGIPIHYYARVDFEGFKDVVDAIDGVELSVSCRLRDWRLKSPELDPANEDNWEQFTLEPGIQQMDGDLALWYARSRLTSNDFYRGRRQQQLLRAMLNQGVDLGLITQVPTLWSTFQNRIETDIDIGRLLQFAALAPSIRQNGVQNLFLAGKTQTWIVPGSGAHVQLPVWEGGGKMQETFRRLFLPPALNRATRPPMTVELIDAAENPDLVVLAADNLAWYGFLPVIAPPDTYPDLQELGSSQLRYYAPNFKGSYDWLISWIFHKGRSQIELISDDQEYPFDYQIVVADDYVPCLDQLYAPQAFLDP